MGLTIGQLANKAAINIETIRYYERRGLIRQPRKPKVGYRRYNDDILQKLFFIKRAKTLGFKLDEIENLLTLAKGHCSDVQLLAEQKLDQVRCKIKDLQSLENLLEKLVSQCDSSVDAVHCPIINKLSANS